MRVLLLSDPYPPVVWGGYELEAHATVAALRDAGHDVLVLSGDAEAGSLPPEPGVLRALHHDRVGDARDTLLAGVRALEGDRLARRVLADHRPEVLYAFNGSGVSRLPILRALEAGVPLLLRACEHWVGRMLTGDRFLRELVPGRRHGARALVGAPARALNRAHPRLRLRLPPPRPHPAAVAWVSRRLREVSPIDPTLLDVRHEEVFPPAGEGAVRFAAAARRPDARPLVLFAGRLSAEKGAHVLVRALGRLAREHDLRPALLMLGPATDAEEAAVHRLATAEGVAGQVELGGRVAQEAVVAAAERAHVWAVPSTWEEPAATTVAEGGLAGVPLVVADVGGNREIVGPEHGALYVPGGDDAALAAAIARRLADPAAAAADAARARRRAVAVASRPVVAARYAAFFEAGLRAVR